MGKSGVPGDGGKRYIGSMAEITAKAQDSYKYQFIQRVLALMWFCSRILGHNFMNGRKISEC